MPNIFVTKAYREHGGKALWIMDLMCFVLLKFILFISFQAFTSSTLEKKRNPTPSKREGGAPVTIFI
jgi:hypothetical protein